MNMVTCDKCSKDFKIELKEEEVKDRISKVYFNCPHCNKEYISYYTSVLIKLKQDKIKKIQEEYNKIIKIDKERGVKIFKQYQGLKREIIREMNKLEKRIEGN